ncbi:MAG: ubiquinol-cytochrome c reductase iron-sulfur subunit [Pseudomonadota bacterium]|jgi:ubiquinol-cytochrome c reductase iron-sulfur subunit|uniref:Ubiquinol-cytochrome c reductase iron-sulfur subunit n=3 Tax=Alteromonas TaxID=226 RepID=A0A350P775_9ALTE|nr:MULTISPECIES: ubiquinol-cytochrome c reductase iron-sulfur subunit [Alteromonas]MAD10785.1 ubiquinol-cytochrome c reductase iron-sulfur subunit [Alteromonas sp.]MBR9793212.1 ubiquinol-cytochrome c reductase iron-sulfur subunit [Gammaproteobacteria bacterium]MDG6098043.1 ubiquinol-cytochrome c reductase iron-sulfur subunit [Alteromonas sp. ZYF713]MDY6928991.1 ubiquinol-cytochrome c reductase iron-sulfur subunit [Pseudomonadota bacterium]HAW77142.1 ubiquinol-cytochrome c reductase iron-sulfur|tara:strand:- start:4227 stop:4859 length:633 start_codon:yes stop_codon:yes gene_type:complete
MSNVSVDAKESALSDNKPQDNPRRRFLTVATSVVGGVGVVGAAVPFVASWNPSAKAKAAGADVEVDISAIEPGQLIRVMWRSKPVWIVRRTPEILAELGQHEDQLRDPNSENEQQPAFAQNQYRSMKEEYLILVGICTHLGCSPQHMKDGAFEEYVEGVPEGFFCPCHGSKFDMAGRVFQNVPAPLNLVVPPYQFVDDTTVIIGSEAEVA